MSNRLISNVMYYLDRSEDVDAIIVNHGGGSDSNLRAFNTERVGDATFTVNTPVVTAIGHTVEDLTQRLTEMNAQIRRWKNEFDVESPNQLRGTIADKVLDVTEEDRHREIAREWEQLQRRIEIVGFAIRAWDFLAPATERGGARR